MSLTHSPQIVTNGLVFYYDMGNPQKSWMGKPTTNFAYTQNARTDTAYSAYSATALGTWNAKHPDAIRVYNDLGSEISAYSNTGVTDWTNTYHAIWTLDPILNRPVVTMRDVDGNWKAKSFGLGQTMTSMGLGYGSTYTISWLQWTDDIAKSANAGLYGQNTSASNNFHDGLSNSFGTSYNTLPYTWQRVHATFTVSGVWNLSAGLTCYMYGHYIKRGTVKIADVQIETGVPSGFSKQQTRSNIQAILDLTNNNTVTANSLTYASNDTFSFNGSSNSLTVNSPIMPTDNFTIELIVNPTSFLNSPIVICPQNAGIDQFIQFNTNGTFIFKMAAGADIGERSYTSSNACLLNSFNHIACVKSSTNIALYLNGVLTASSSSDTTATAGWGSTTWVIGQRGNGTFYFSGSVPVVKAYSRGLLATEVQQNFNALRGRYGL
jgi:hypothetical protein